MDVRTLTLEPHALFWTVSEFIDMDDEGITLKSGVSEEVAAEHPDSRLSEVLDAWPELLHIEWRMSGASNPLNYTEKAQILLHTMRYLYHLARADAQG